MQEKIDKFLSKVLVLNAILIFLAVNITLICCVIGRIEVIYTYYTDEKCLANSVYLIFACLMGEFVFNLFSVCFYKTFLSGFLEE